MGGFVNITHHLSAYLRSKSNAAEPTYQSEWMQLSGENTFGYCVKQTFTAAVWRLPTSASMIPLWSIPDLVDDRVKIKGRTDAASNWLELPNISMNCKGFLLFQMNAKNE